jgi:hypothetical protein
MERFLGYSFLMSKKPRDPPLRVVSNLDPIGLQPSRPLGEHGRRLWDRVLAEYIVDDVAGVELLSQACAALDRAEALAAHVEADGAIVRTPAGIKAHPGIREELAARGFVVRTLQKLGLNYEPLRSGPGRPPGRGAA